MVKRIPIQINDNQKRNMRDKVTGLGGEFQPKGKVRIHERKIEGTDKKLYFVTESNNLIVYRGRNWLLQRAFNNDMDNRANWKDKYLSWLAVGTGGAVSGSPLEPSSPELPNFELNNHGTMNAGTRFVTVDGKDYHNFDTGYPKFLNDPDVENDDLATGCTAVDPEDGQTYRCDKFLIGLIKVTLTSAEANGGTEAGDYQDISEAGLYISPSNSLSASFGADDMSLFARVCFSTIRKDINRELIFSWYLYF